MRVSYYKNGKKYITKVSNTDVKISEYREGNHTQVRLLASEEITLAKADVSKKGVTDG